MALRTCRYAFGLDSNGKAVNAGQVVFETQDTIRVSLCDGRGFSPTGELRDIPKSSAKMFDDLGAMRDSMQHAAAVTLSDGTQISLDRAKERLAAWDCPLGKIIKRFGDWCVTDYGIEYLAHPYFIEQGRVHEEDWLQHMGEKDWVNILHFSAALNFARKR